MNLKTLHEYSEQEVFDHVALHLMQQNSKSVIPPTTDNWHDAKCVYRSPDGKMCAAGCLIADDEYKPHMEDSTWMVLANTGFVPRHHADLIRRLQIAHDAAELKAGFMFEEELRAAAARFNLNTQVIDRYIAHCAKIQGTNE